LLGKTTRQLVSGVSLVRGQRALITARRRGCESVAAWEACRANSGEACGWCWSGWRRPGV